MKESDYSFSMWKCASWCCECAKCYLAFMSTPRLFKGSFLIAEAPGPAQISVPNGSSVKFSGTVVPQLRSDILQVPAGPVPVCTSRLSPSCFSTGTVLQSVGQNCARMFWNPNAPVLFFRWLVSTELTVADALMQKKERQKCFHFTG